MHAGLPIYICRESPLADVPGCETLLEGKERDSWPGFRKKACAGIQELGVPFTGTVSSRGWDSV